MDLFEVKLESPIGYDEIIRLRSNLIRAQKHDFLIIDLGHYDFASLEVITYLKDQLSDLEPCLMKFKKIALLHTPIIKIKSNTPQKYHLFGSKEDATNWFLGAGNQ